MTFQINSKLTSTGRGTLITTFQPNTSTKNLSETPIISESNLNELAEAAEAARLLGDNSSVGFQVADDLINNQELDQVSEQQEEDSEARGAAIGYRQDEQQEDIVNRIEESGQPERRQGQLGDRGMQSVLLGVEAGPANVEEEFGIVEVAPHGSRLEQHAQNGAEGSNKNTDLLALGLFGKVFADAGGLVMDVITGDTKGATCKFGALAGGFFGGFAGIPGGPWGMSGGYTAGSIAFEEVCRAANNLESERLKSTNKLAETYAKYNPQADDYSSSIAQQKANAFYTENPLNEHLTGENFLSGTRDYDLRMEALRNYDPTRDPSEENAGNGYQRIIEDLNVVQSMDLFHGGTSTGAFTEKGTVRLDQADFAGFLGSNDGTSTGGDQLI